MERKKVYLLFEGDSWLSTKSLVLMGVFSNEGDLTGSFIELVKLRLDEGEVINDSFDSDEEYLEEALRMWNLNGQHSGNGVSWIKKISTLNKLEEI